MSNEVNTIEVAEATEATLASNVGALVREHAAEQIAALETARQTLAEIEAKNPETQVFPGSVWIIPMVSHLRENSGEDFLATVPEGKLREDVLEYLAWEENLENVRETWDSDHDAAFDAAEVAFKALQATVAPVLSELLGIIGRDPTSSTPATVGSTTTGTTRSRAPRVHGTKYVINGVTYNSTKEAAESIVGVKHYTESKTGKIKECGYSYGALESMCRARNFTLVKVEPAA